MSLIDDKKVLRASRGAFPTFIRRSEWYLDRIRRYQLNNLKYILTHAKQHSLWYKETLSKIDIAEFKWSDLEKIPVLNKKDIMDNWDKIITTPAINFKLACELVKSNAPHSYPYQIVKSGGSTATPGVYLYDRSAWMSAFNSIIRFFQHESAIQNIKKRKICRVTLAAPFSNHMTSNLMQHLKNQIEDVYLPVTMPYNLVLQNLARCSVDILQGYPSILVRLAYSQKQGEINIQPGFIISMAEPLTESVRQLLNKTWSVKIYDAWACGEFGPLAVSCPSCNNLILNSDHCLIEYKFNQNSKFSDGVIVTGLHNKVMPLIRYNLGDLVEKSEEINECCRHKEVIAGVLGRPATLFQYGPVKVHGYCFRSVILDYPKLTNYQFQQTVSGIALILDNSSQLSESQLSEIKSKLTNALVDVGLKTPEVEILISGNFQKTIAGKIPKFIPLR